MPIAPPTSIFGLPLGPLVGQTPPASANPTSTDEDGGLTAAEQKFTEVVERISPAGWHCAQQDEPSFEAAIGYIRRGKPATLPLDFFWTTQRRNRPSFREI